MGKFFGWLILLLIIGAGGGYYYYTQTGYKFGLDDTFLFKGTIGIVTTSFADGGVIPAKFTCDGEDVSPEFSLSRIPSGTKSLAVILEDRSIKPNPVTHWLVYNFNSEFNIIDSSIAWQNGSVGTNDFGDKEYKGPCPPMGKTHNYIFRVYALNFTIQNENMSRLAFDRVTESHILATGSLMGTYTRNP